MRRIEVALVCAVAAAALCAPWARAAGANENRIQPYSKNPRYWQYRGEPVLLLGGSKDDNLFQLPDLKAHLDEIKEAGGNVIRNTMSDRQDGGFELRAFRRLPGGKYDLNQWNDAYWKRFADCLTWCEEREIVVQIEVWDRFDYSQTQWETSPWQPANNVNYTSGQSGLANAYPEPAWRDRQPFFHTIPGMRWYRRQLDVLRAYQEKFVAKVLSYSLGHGNVLYCMDNETSTEPAWGMHWMAFITGKAAHAGVNVYVTDMFDDGWRPAASGKVRLAIDHPETYTFIDISQVNSRVFDEEHWRRFLWVVQQLEKSPRPVNNTKIYSAGETIWGSGTPKDGVERFWRNLIGGAASCRFHRPGGGIGLNETAKACIAAARKLETRVRLWEVAPRLDLLSERSEDEAYLAADPGERYALYFTDGGSVRLDLSAHPHAFTLKWINVSTGEWGGEAVIQGGGLAAVTAPGEGGYVAAIVRK